jgi:hypothetical protein|tara:strand:- start:1125 stop:2480 length:1356 start_codon:yes stop_codon:yes gene_type:complete
MSDSLPKSMLYARQGVNAVEAESTLRRWDSVNGSANFRNDGANEIRIKISAGNSFLDGGKHYLYFEVQGATAAFNIDGHAGSFFDRITLESNGQMLERLDRYAVYSNLKKFYCGKNKINNDNVKEGSLGLIWQTPDATANVANTQVEVALSSLGVTVATGTSKIFCIQLESGLLHNHRGLAIPMGASEIDLVLRVKQNAGAVVSVGAPTWTINTPRFYAPCYTILNGDVLSMYRTMMGQSGILIGGDTAKTYVNSISNGASDSQVVQINDRSLSCKALVSVLRLGTADSSLATYSNTGFQLGDGTGNVTKYEYKINGESYPRSGVDVNILSAGRNVGRAYEEATKSLARHGEKYSDSTVTLEQFAGSLTNVFAADAPQATTITKGIMCVDLKKFDDASLRMIGMNTAQNSSPNVLEISKTAMAAGDKEIITFSIVEAFWSVSPTGTWSVAM